MDDSRLLRYSRQILLPEIDITGQEKLLDAGIAIIGIGGLGSPAALYLAAAGIGRLTLVDDDVVELSNLQRQVIHDEAHIGANKADSARAALGRVNRAVDTAVIADRLDEAGMCELCERVDVVLDGTDNFASRQLINRACVTTRTPLVSGAAIRFEGQLSVFDKRDDANPCYACLYGADSAGDDDNCSSNGILAPVVGIVGTAMAVEAIKLVCGAGSPLVGRLLLLDALAMKFRELGLRRDPGCEVCGDHRHEN